MGPGWPGSPAHPLPHVLVHLGQLGLQVGQQSVQQLCYPPLLLGQTSLQHVEQTGPRGGTRVSCCYGCTCTCASLLSSPRVPEGAAPPTERTVHQQLKQPVQFSGVATFLFNTPRNEMKDILTESKLLIKAAFHA